jgi:hypothetical protein
MDRALGRRGGSHQFIVMVSKAKLTKTSTPNLAPPKLKHHAFLIA